jgi:hypothetical protein
MILVAKTKNGVLIKQLLNRVQLMDLLKVHNVPLSDINQFSFAGQARVFEGIIDLVQFKKIEEDVYKIDLATYTYIIDLLNDYG